MVYANITGEINSSADRKRLCNAAGACLNQGTKWRVRIAVMIF